jgi:hypothetical protein
MKYRIVKKPNIWTDIEVYYPEFRYDTEVDAVIGLAKKLKLKLWQEEN